MLTSENQNSKIELLPEHIIDQIKAGEVLERPASLIKELIENSIDAKASDIQLQIVDSGMELISIEDNGHGINFDDLPYAFLRHATSKLKTFEDLYHLYSYGFRGEALASIAASARVTCQSQPLNLKSDGGKIIINGGKEELLVPMKNTRSGTSLYIKNLFYNTPARLKFIKSKTSEKIQIKKIIYSFLISHPEINFSIKWDEKEKEVFKSDNGNHDFLHRFEQIIFGRTKEKTPLLKATTDYEGHSVSIIFSLEASKNGPNKHQYLFANNRLFFDKNLHQTIIRTTDSIWKYGESGHYAVFISCPPEEIDVNVHPNKTQIKFSKTDTIYSLLVTAIKDAIKNYQQQNVKNPSQDSKLQTEFDQDSLTPLSLFNEEDQATMSLQNLRDMKFDSRPIPSSLSQLSSASNALDNRPGIIILTSQFFIFEFNHQKHLADKKILFIDYVNQLCQLSLLAEENISPLLVSEPFKVGKKIDYAFDIMKKMGFEFDRLGPEVIVLRTIPQHIHRDFIKVSAHLIIQYFSDYHQTAIDLKFLKNTMDQLVQKSVISLDTIDASILFRIYESRQSRLIELSKQLTNSNLVEFFNE